MQFGVQLYSLRELIGQKGLKEALRLVSAAGFSRVFTDTARSSCKNF